jgi:hypothetical protein
MWCIERCIKYINVSPHTHTLSLSARAHAHTLTHRFVCSTSSRQLNAYVQTCIYGTNFCTSAFHAFWLLLRNIARLAAASAVTHFIVLIGKVK